MAIAGNASDLPRLGQGRDGGDLDLLIVGAGFAGMAMLHRARRLGFTARLLEAGGDVGGTWYWNRYPGARCDVESMEYSYAFDDELQQQWHWTERFAAQPEILRYARHVAERFDLRRDMCFNTRVLRAWFDDGQQAWTLGCDDGVERRARFLVLATGCLSSANRPVIRGMDSFKGPSYHTGQWPHEGVDFSGQRVAVVGTGSSAVQAVPVIARQARELWVLQRTAAYSVPARNVALDPREEAEVKADYRAFRARNAAMITAFGAKAGRNDRSALSASAAERNAEFERRWQLGGIGFMASFNDLLRDRSANDHAAEFVRGKIRAVVKDPATADLLSPRQIIGCKRLCLDSGYFETFNLPHVRLLDISGGGIEEINASGLRAAGRQIDVDAIVFATGFDAMTGSLLKIDIRGRAGLELCQAWAAGPRTYLGLGVSGFPNLFTISGPGSPSVLTNMIVSIEQHVQWIGDCLAWMRERGHRSIEACEPAQRVWVAHVNAVANSTLYPGCNSWYLGANVPGKTRVFMPLLGFPPYVEKCNEVAASGYRGFAFA